MCIVPWKENLFGLNSNQTISRIMAFLNGKLTGILNIKNMVDGHLSWPRGSSNEASNFSELKAREPWSLWQEAWIMNLACSSWCLGARSTFHVQRPVKLKDAGPGEPASGSSCFYVCGAKSRFSVGFQLQEQLWNLLHHHAVWLLRFSSPRSTFAVLLNIRAFVPRAAGHRCFPEV